MVKSLIASVGVFKGLEDAELELLEKNAKEEVLPTDTIIFKQGDVGDKMYLIVRGIIEIWRSEGHDIKGIRLARLRQGEIFGEMALFDKEPRSATAITSLAPETKMLVWDEKDLYQIIKNYPVSSSKILMSFLRNMSSRLRVANDAIHTLLRSNQYIGL